ncbi:MAG TPA: hypothetical protein VEB69_15370 [Acidimicrobiia bacterium]|nr:hypothetical protein [Acidimicrobiia bacterium]
MSKNIDDQIRELFAQVDEVAPEPPAVQVPEVSPFPWGKYVLAPAAAVIAFVLGTAVVLDAVGVDLGLGAAAGDGVDTIPDQRDDGPISLLVDLNLACGDLISAIQRTPGGASDETASQTLAAYIAILEDFETATVAAIDGVEAPDSLVISVGEVADIRAEVAVAVSRGSVGASERLSTIDDSLAALGADLADEGATTCGGIP